MKDHALLPVKDIAKYHRMKEGYVSLWEVMSLIDSDRFLNKKELSEFTSLSVRTINRMLPQIPHYRVGKKILFRKNEVLAGFEKYRVRSISPSLDERAKMFRNREKNRVKNNKQAEGQEAVLPSRK